MTVIGFVGDVADVAPVVTWAGRLASINQSELLIFYISDFDTGVRIESVSDLPIGAIENEPRYDKTLATINKAIEGIVRNKRARKGRLARHAISLRRVDGTSSINDILAKMRVESPDLFVGATRRMPAGNGKSLSQQIASKLTCDTIVLFDDGEGPSKAKRLVVVTSDGVHDKGAIGLASQASDVLADGASVVGIEETLGEGAIEVQERGMRKLLRELDLCESARFKIEAIQADDWKEAVVEQACDCDLLLLGGNVRDSVSQILKAQPAATVGIFERAARLTFARKQSASWILPQISQADYSDLYEQLQTGSRWNVDYIFMLCMAAAIATLGLLQDSPAVVIGSMLLAPMMTPMIGMGLALNQGNTKLAQSASRAIGRGFLAALAISFSLALVTPGSDLTPQVVARTEPNVLDLLIALFSGTAAAYALARPSLAGTIAGVAIATAIVPPLCSTGISIAYKQYFEAIGSLSLLLANVLAIILAAAGTFRSMGLSAFTANSPRRFWVRHVVAGLTLCVLAITVPLASNFMRQVLEGKDAPIAFALTNDVREALSQYIDKKPGLEIIFAGRSGVHRESKPVDIGIILSSKYPLPHSEEAEIVNLLRNLLQNPDLQVRIECVAQGWAEESVRQPGSNDLQ